MPIGEQLETQYWIETARDCSYISQADSDKLLQQCYSIGKNDWLHDRQVFIVLQTKAESQKKPPTTNTEP
jgi:23S rRNA-intervening sequence protein